jgi:hypothetical protein
MGNTYIIEKIICYNDSQAQLTYSRKPPTVLPEISRRRPISEMFFPLIRNFPPAPLFLLQHALLYNPWFLTLGRSSAFATEESFAGSVRMRLVRIVE